MNSELKNKFIQWALAVLQMFIGITAVVGGFGLVSDPSGAQANVPLALLKNSPFKDYFIPGLVLLIVNGAGNVLAGIVTFLRTRYAGNLAVFLGAFLMVYMTVEVWVLGLQNFSQPLYFALGVVESMLGLKLSKSVQRGQRIRTPTGEVKSPTYNNGHPIRP